MKREEALDVALGQIERQFGKGSVMRMSDRPQVAVGAVSTGSLALDMALGIGGLPRGRIAATYSLPRIRRTSTPPAENSRRTAPFLPRRQRSASRRLKFATRPSASCYRPFWHSS